VTSSRKSSIVRRIAASSPLLPWSDGNPYVEVARAMAERGSSAAKNGLELVSSRELSLEHMLTIAPYRSGGARARRLHAYRVRA